jgi:hypothetical protein
VLADIGVDPADAQVTQRHGAAGAVGRGSGQGCVSGVVSKD